MLSCSVLFWTATPLDWIYWLEKEEMRLKKSSFISKPTCYITLDSTLTPSYRLVTFARTAACTKKNILSAFEATANWPLNPYKVFLQQTWNITRFDYLLAVEILIARSLDFLKYRYVHEPIYAIFGVCLVCLVRMHAHSAGISSWVWHDHHLREIMHHTTEAIRQGDKPYMPYSPLLLCSVEQENKQRIKQTVIPIVASLKPCVASEQGKSTTVAWGWPSIERQGNPRAQTKSKTSLNPTFITIAPLPLWISRAYPSSRPWLVCLPHSRSCARRSSWLFVVYADLDCCDSKRRYA